MLDTENVTISANQLNILSSSFVDNFTSSSKFADDLQTDKSKLDISYAIIETLIAVLAVVGNALVIVVFFRERRLRKRTNYYIISLAFADFLLGLIGIPFAVLVSICRQTKMSHFKLKSLLDFRGIPRTTIQYLSLDDNIAQIVLHNINLQLGFDFN